jgi:hypothetical protein
MKTTVDARLRREAERFHLRFACDDCAHFNPGAANPGAANPGAANPGAANPGGARCSLEYPAAPRRDALDGPDLELCKSFELG